MPKIKPKIEDYKPDPRLVDERGPTKERVKTANGAVHTDDKGKRYFRDTTIERALTRGVITSGEYTAANKYHLHWYRGGLASTLGSPDMGRIFGSDPSNMSGMAKTEHQAFHRQQYRKAVQRIGIKGATILENVICHDLTLEQAGYKLGWGHKMQAIAAATEILRDRLDVLCGEWGIST